jgi:hypothetical protein
MTNLLPDPSRSAVLSDCQRYRYSLTRRWAESGPIDVWIGLNPSTADAEKDDATIRKICAFSRSWGSAGIVMLNLFAFRATLPSDMLAAEDPVGPGNDAAILAATAGTPRIRVIAAWGVHGIWMTRDQEVMRLLFGKSIYALHLNNDGSPGHPLYLPMKNRLVPFGIGGTR